MPQQTASAPEGLKRLIINIARKEGFKDFAIEYKKISTNGANYLGSLYLVDIKEGKRELNLFGKVSNTPEEARKQIKANEIYTREVFFYETLASVFTDLEIKYDVPQEHRFKITKYYGSDLTDLEEVLVLENIVKEGYVLYDRFKSVDWEYTSAAIEELTKFHALSYALKKDDPGKFDTLIKSKPTMFGKDEPSENFRVYMEGLFKTAIAACDKDHVPAITKFFEGMKGFADKNNLADEYSVLAHADYRQSNLLVKYEEGFLKSLIPIDYQTAFYGSPLNDLMYFLFTGSDQEFRSKHYESYIQLYYDSLGRALARFSLDINEVYPRAVFDQHVKEKLLHGLSMAVFLLPIVLVAPEDAPNFGDVGKIEIKVSKLYNERLRGIVQDLVKLGALKV